MVMVEELNKSKRKGNMDKGLKLSVGKYKPMGGGVRGSKKDKKKPNLRRSHLGCYNCSVHFATIFFWPCDSSLKWTL
jgi:hypothetical protein